MNALPKFKAHFDGRVLIPDERVEIPTDCTLEVEVCVSPVEHAASPLEKLAELAEKFPPNPDAPIDGAAQHDHYLYGTPERE